MPAESDGDRKSALVWDFMRLGFAGRVASLAAFGLIYSVLMILGLVLRESSQQLTIIWPAAGLLFMALWFSRGAIGSGSWACRWPRRSRSMSHGTIILIGARTGHSSSPIRSTASSARSSQSAHVDSGNSAAPARFAVPRGGCARRRGKRRSGCLRFDAALGSSHYFREWQLWWQEWLGSLCIAPVVMAGPFDGTRANTRPRRRRPASWCCLGARCSA